MKRVILTSLVLVVFAWISGCSNSNSSSSGSGTTATSPALLNGQYGFSMSGFDSSGNPMSMGGSFKADGAGHVTAGDVDVNDNGTISSSTALSGTYSFDSSGQGILGTIVLTNTVGSVTHPLAFGFALNAAGAFGDIMSLDTNNFIMAGTMQQQSSSVFTLAGLAGNYIVTVNGRSSANPTAALGRFTLASSGSTTNVSFDRSISNVGTAGPTTTPTPTPVVTFTGAPDANGRGTMVIGFNDGLTANATQNFAYYAINATRFVAVEIDNVGTMIVDGSNQSSGIPTTAVTTGAVFGIAGVDTSTTAEISAVGQIVITGATATGGTLAWDSNDNGGIVNIPTLTGQAVTYNTATGRGTIAIASGVTNGLANSLVFYLTAPGTGFIMDATTGPTNRAMGGILTAQTGTSFSTATDLPGLAEVRSKGSATTDAQAIIGAFGLTSTAGTYALLADQRFPTSSTTISTLTDSNISGITIASLNATTGRGTMLVSGSSVETLAFYVIGPNQFVFIDISPVSSGINGATSLFFATPD